MNASMNRLKTTAVIALVLAVGIGAAYMASKEIRTQAEVVWDNSADAETRRLTGTLMQWIETTLTPLHALAALFQSSEQVFDAEFWDTVTLLEENQGDFFPSSLVVAQPAGFGDFETWEVVYSVEYEGRLTPGPTWAKSRRSRAPWQRRRKTQARPSSAASIGMKPEPFGSFRRSLWNATTDATSSWD